MSLVHTSSLTPPSLTVTLPLLPPLSLTQLVLVIPLHDELNQSYPGGVTALLTTVLLWEHSQTLGEIIERSGMFPTLHPLTLEEPYLIPRHYPILSLSLSHSQPPHRSAHRVCTSPRDHHHLPANQRPHLSQDICRRKHFRSDLRLLVPIHRSHL